MSKRLRSDYESGALLELELRLTKPLDRLIRFLQNLKTILCDTYTYAAHRTAHGREPKEPYLTFDARERYHYTLIAKQNAIEKDLVEGDAILERINNLIAERTEVGASAMPPPEHEDEDEDFALTVDAFIERVMNSLVANQSSSSFREFLAMEKTRSFLNIASVERVASYLQMNKGKIESKFFSSRSYDEARQFFVQTFPENQRLETWQMKLNQDCRQGETLDLVTALRRHSFASYVFKPKSAFEETTAFLRDQLTKHPKERETIMQILLEIQAKDLGDVQHGKFFAEALMRACFLVHLVYNILFLREEQSDFHEVMQSIADAAHADLKNKLTQYEKETEAEEKAEAEAEAAREEERLVGGSSSKRKSSMKSKSQGLRGRSKSPTRAKSPKKQETALLKGGRKSRSRGKSTGHGTRSKLPRKTAAK